MAESSQHQQHPMFYFSAVTHRSLEFMEAELCLITDGAVLSLDCDWLGLWEGSCSDVTLFSSRGGKWGAVSRGCVGSLGAAGECLKPGGGVSVEMGGGTSVCVSG